MSKDFEYGFNINTITGSDCSTTVIEREETKKAHDTTSLEEAKARMKRNLDNLLHYDFNEKSANTEAMAEAATVSEQVSAVSEEDLKPTSTTLQFGDVDINQIYQEMEERKSREKEVYKLNSKGKLVIVLYSLAVAVIMALIVLNTGVLAMISKNYDSKVSELSALREYNIEINNEIESISGAEHVADVAQNELGMVLR